MTGFPQVYLSKLMYGHLNEPRNPEGTGHLRGWPGFHLNIWGMSVAYVGLSSLYTLVRTHLVWTPWGDTMGFPKAGKGGTSTILYVNIPPQLLLCLRECGHLSLPPRGKQF